VAFIATTGHSRLEFWIISAKASNSNGLGLDENTRGYALCKSLASGGLLNLSDIIPASSQIRIQYRERRGEQIIEHDDLFSAATEFANLEEWWHQSNIGDRYFRDAGDVWFRRGTLTPSGDYTIFNQTTTGDMTLIIRSVTTGSGVFSIGVTSTITITSSEQHILFETIPLNNNAEVFYEIGRTYNIGSNRFHLGFDGNTDVDQSSGVPAKLTLPTFNCFAWGNGFESYKIKDLFNNTNFKLDSRPFSTIDDYRENVRLASLSYSKVYEQTTNYNGLNEFNLSTANFKDLDDKFESIQKIYNRDTNLIVFQEDKIHRVPYTKNILFSTDGSGNVTQSTDILGTEFAYAGEYGMSTNPESFAFYGNAIYFTDVRRAVVCRLDINGIIEISELGMDDFFEDSFRSLLTGKKIGAFDLYNKQYALSADQGPTVPTPIIMAYTITFDESVKGWTSFHSYIPDWMGSMNSKFYTVKNGQLFEQNDETNPVRNNFYGVQYSTVLEFIINQHPSDIKFLKALNIESNKAFGVIAASYLNDETLDTTQSSINVGEFLNKEGKWYAYVRRNELTGDLTAKNAYGLGTLASVSGSIITMNSTIPNSLISIGDELHDSNNALIGTITDYNVLLGTITVNVAPTITGGTFVYGLKSGRIEGSEIRGYNFKIIMTDQTTNRLELFAVNSELAKSFPS
jgi:hypothetical protein